MEATNLFLLQQNTKGTDKQANVRHFISVLVIPTLEKLARLAICKFLYFLGAQRLSGRVLDLRSRGRGLESRRCQCVVSLSKNINPSLVLVQPRKTRPFITERFFMGR